MLPKSSSPGLSPRKRGRKKDPTKESASRIAKLERENLRLKNKLDQAEKIIEIQKKVAALLGNPIEPSESGKNE